jgi:hypothetical protein
MRRTKRREMVRGSLTRREQSNQETKKLRKFTTTAYEYGSVKGE